MRAFGLFVFLISQVAIAQYTTGLVHPEHPETTGVWDDLSPQPEMPSYFDWKDKAPLQPIRNQGSCGACWAFATTAVVESLFYIAHKAEHPIIDLAEQTLVSACEPRYDCNGGYFDALDYIQNKGLPAEHDDPYLGKNSACKNSPAIQHIASWKFIGSVAIPPAVAQIKTAILQYGPLAVDISATQALMGYKSGVFTQCSFSNFTNHMVVIEGWTDDPAYRRNGGGYWHVRNSWGADWGDGGRFKIVYKNKFGFNCNGVGNMAAYARL